MFIHRITFGIILYKKEQHSRSPVIPGHDVELHTLLYYHVIFNVFLLVQLNNIIIGMCITVPMLTSFLFKLGLICQLNEFTRTVLSIEHTEDSSDVRVYSHLKRVIYVILKTTAEKCEKSSLPIAMLQYYNFTIDSLHALAASLQT